MSISTAHPAGGSFIFRRLSAPTPNRPNAAPLREADLKITAPRRAVSIRLAMLPAFAAAGLAACFLLNAKGTVEHHFVPPPTVTDAAARNLNEPVQVVVRDALMANSVTPFVALGNDRPIPLRVDKESNGYLRALDCLASALIYEAGDDRHGQAAVAQVVLNRLHHPAFPHSICEVVYQGSERATGCQFTFTCDGALGRMPSPAAWRRAQKTAADFLAGEIDPTVGLATHYHTEQVHPYWSATLDKIAKVGDHLFFRWRGSWGRKAAFGAHYVGDEPYQLKLAALSLAHNTADGTVTVAAGTLPTVEPTTAAATLTKNPGEHFILVDGGGNGTGLAMQGLNECIGQTYCKVVGWDRRSQTNGAPARPLIGTVAFLYVSDKRTGVEIVLWDCARFNRPVDTQCLSDRNRRWITFQGDLSRAS